ncbi:hypothetical protein Tco_1449730 [Tanacetum coccineum]
MSSPSSQKQLNSPNVRCDNDSVSLPELKKNRFVVLPSLNDLKTKHKWLMKEFPRLNKDDRGGRKIRFMLESYGKLKSEDKIKANVYFAWMAREVPKCLVLTGCVGPVIDLILSRVPVKEQHVRSNDEIKNLDCMTSKNITGVAMGDDMLQESDKSLAGLMESPVIVGAFTYRVTINITGLQLSASQFGYHHFNPKFPRATRSRPV